VGLCQVCVTSLSTCIHHHWHGSVVRGAVSMNSIGRWSPCVTLSLYHCLWYRLEERILSAVSQQILTIQLGLRQNADNIALMGALFDFIGLVSPAVVR